MSALAPAIEYIASVSGGKDSTAMCLHLRELGIPFRAVFFDTGWEHPSTYDYVRNVLPMAFEQDIEIRSREPSLDERREAYAVELEGMLGFRSPFVRWMLARGMFPSRVRRYCTQELKVFTCRDVMREEHAASRAPVNVIGIRADESAARAKLPERELSTTLDCMVWRPLLRWSVRDVVDIHRRHKVEPNPLYLRGSSRVGCWPCIMAGKRDLRLLDEPRIAVLERLEQIVGDLAAARAEARGEELRARPAFFQAPSDHLGSDDEGHKKPCVPIRRMVEWARTTHGGREEDRQVSIPGLNDGCLQWGLCDLGDGT